ncbi:MAG: hypothetical protein CMI73_02695 [Candidatus Pelagibacter sp.]|nr:hypothetical protein [Candidatus Pelagibacter sp.]OUV87309.1 MAG: hypothetical protein CBC96_02465 [Pelagibacteraceae bacterium TMED136]|tara:strand:+ start:601 stop:855 length:255 start_codon:yes stop_codon:yes gene_type:complete
MSLTGSIVVFVVLWWLILFMILPRNITSQKDNGYVIEGTDPGAPENPEIKKKLLLTTAITLIIFVIIYFLNYFNILNIRALLSQ